MILDPEEYANSSGSTYRGVSEYDNPLGTKCNIIAKVHTMLYQKAIAFGLAG